jgi:hypothetical protein
MESPRAKRNTPASHPRLGYGAKSLELEAE